MNANGALAESQERSNMKLKEVIACTIGVCAIMLMGGSIYSTRAQAAATGDSVALQRWNSADEISFTGTIDEVATNYSSGTPIGVNLLVDGAPPFQRANLGSQLNSSIKSQLAPGQTVTLKGIVRSFNGQSVLLVRSLTIGQQTTLVRSARGIVSPLVETSSTQGNRPRGKNATTGGAQ
jgi:hypothetical protein